MAGLTQSASSPVDEAKRGGVSIGESTDVFRLLVQSVKDYAIFVLDPSGHVLTWNPGAQALKGYTSEEIIGKHFSVFYQAEAIQSGWPQQELVMAEKEGRFVDEGWRLKKDGTTFWASVTITALWSANGKLSGFAKVTQDLTERKRAEERVQTLNRQLRERVAELDEARHLVELRTIELQKLSAQLLQIQDTERRRLARELHDELGQELVALKMTLPETSGNETAHKHADTTISMVRNLSYLLHPPLLDEAGLRAALHWFVEGLAQRSKIEVSLEVTPHAFPRLPSGVETAIFRVVQESLINVYRHSASSKARVELEKQAEFVVIRVRDYGKGVPAEVVNPTQGIQFGVGIGGMRERVRQLRGELTISRAEPGTLVEARISLF